MPISVIVNDQSVEVPSNYTVTQLLQQLALRGGPVAVERNQQLVPTPEQSLTTLKNGDCLEIVSLTGGG